MLQLILRESCQCHWLREEGIRFVINTAHRNTDHTFTSNSCELISFSSISSTGCSRNTVVRESESLNPWPVTRQITVSPVAIHARFFAYRQPANAAAPAGSHQMPSSRNRRFWAEKIS